jgi:hypothetical protein
MRASIVLATASASLAIIAACAGTEDEAPPPPVTPPATIPDGGAPDVDVPDVDVPDTRLPDCSSAGWCVTPFPDENLVFRDIWPLEDVAFAIADSRTEGVKFLEWKKSTNAWEYIDDLTQNGAGSGTFAGGVYAPSADEVYFAVGASYVYHGKRPASPETKWTWTRAKLPDGIVGHPTSHDHGKPWYSASRETVDAFGLWGAGADDVYAYFSNTIFKHDPTGDTWSAVYTIDDLEADDEHAFFVSASGTGPDDIWFVGARDRTYFNCPLVVRKKANGWERVADGVVSNDIFAQCSERAGTLHVGGGTGGWFTDIQPVSATEYVALHDQIENGFFKEVNLTRIRVSENGYSLEQSVVPVKLALPGPVPLMSSLWRGHNETWFTSFGLVVRGTDDGTYAVSTLSRDGAPVTAPLYKIRGTSNQNLWAIGAHHAYHKTTP